MNHAANSPTTAQPQQQKQPTTPRLNLQHELQPSQAPKKKLQRNFEWKGERELEARRVLEADRKRRGETKEETERKMKKKMEEEQERMEEINRKNREEMARDKERAAEKLRRMEAKARG